MKSLSESNSAKQFPRHHRIRSNSTSTHLNGLNDGQASQFFFYHDSSATLEVPPVSKSHKRSSFIQITEMIWPNSQLTNEIAAYATNTVNKPETTPVTASKLHPRNVKLIVCLGDSLLAGLCLTKHPETIKNKMISGLTKLGVSPWVAWLVSGEHRQNTCISGGASGIISIGRLIKHYSPQLEGLCDHKTALLSTGSGFNFARSGSTVSDLLRQSQLLLSKLQTPQYTSLQDEWKFIAIWIGANDIFLKSIQYIESNFKQSLLTAIQFLKSSFHRAYVCILTTPDLSSARPGLNSKQQQRTRTKTDLVNRILKHAVDEYNWNTDEFRVVLITVPEGNVEVVDYAGFIGLDNAHPNVVAHQLICKAFWSNLFDSGSDQVKNFEQIKNEPWFQPTESDFFK
ncbi:hypothetical protein HK098_003703 [Nowakowskiella sp. JEL0407]|nr:hypothetical protein HK098_003703 [Nowakowskiella sp. JEL0407]